MSACLSKIAVVCSLHSGKAKILSSEINLIQNTKTGRQCPGKTSINLIGRPFPKIPSHPNLAQLSLRYCKIGSETAEFISMNLLFVSSLHPYEVRSSQLKTRACSMWTLLPQCLRWKHF